MINIDTIINQLKGLYKSKERVVFDYPPYVEFHNNLTDFIYRNHLDERKEWAIIKSNLVVKSSQYMVRQEADVILVELENLKRVLLKRKYENFWEYVHPQIKNVAENKFFDGYYADSVESAFKEINSRVKQIYLKYKNEEKDGRDLMFKAFSAETKLLVFEGTDTESARNVQEGYKYIFAGAIQAIRNPKAHANMNISREDAMKRLVLAGLLMDKIDEAVNFSNLEEW